MAEEKEKPPTLPEGVSEIEFNNWKQSPVTKAYLNFLKRTCDSLTDGAVDAWIGGNLQIATADFERGRIVAFSDASDPRFETIINFYEGQKNNE